MGISVHLKRLRPGLVYPISTSAKHIKLVLFARWMTKLSHLLTLTNHQYQCKVSPRITILHKLVILSPRWEMSISQPREIQFSIRETLTEEEIRTLKLFQTSFSHLESKLSEEHSSRRFTVSWWYNWSSQRQLSLFSCLLNLLKGNYQLRKWI